MNLEIVLLGWLALALMMSALWLWQRRSGDAGIVDVGWAAGLGFLAVLYAATGEGFGPRRLLLAVVVGVWSFRLASYLLFDRVLSGEEDGRYQELRRNWGDRVQPRFFVFFQAQALLDLLLSLPFLVVAAHPVHYWTLWDGLAVALWLLALGGEWIADRQLAAFRARPENRGKTCRQGLWRYSRHPNYFFEWLHWWVYVLLAVGASYFWVTLIGPALMLFFILKVTGIPPTEERALLSRGEDYRRYQRTTSAFFPWFPREDAQ